MSIRDFQTLRLLSVLTSFVSTVGLNLGTLRQSFNDENRSAAAALHKEKLFTFQATNFSSNQLEIIKAIASEVSMPIRFNKNHFVTSKITFLSIYLS